MAERAVLLLAVLAACAVGPSYRRPAVAVPEATRGQHGPADATSLADAPWWTVFGDPALQARNQTGKRMIHPPTIAHRRARTLHPATKKKQEFL